MYGLLLRWTPPHVFVGCFTRGTPRVGELGCPPIQAPELVRLVVVHGLHRSVLDDDLHPWLRCPSPGSKMGGRRLAEGLGVQAIDFCSFLLLVVGEQF